MNKSFMLLIAVLSLVANSATAQPCCQKPTGMQSLALNKSFKAAHLAPTPYSYAPEHGAMMQFPTAGGANGNAFFVPATEGSDKVLIIFHEWWGLNDYIKKEAEKWSELLGGKVAVYAVDLYDGRVASLPEEAGKLMNTLTPQRGEAIVNGLIQKIGGDAKIATLGWCMGGSWSFTGAVLAGASAKGCVMYYGFPEKDPARIKPLKCDILYIRGAKDNFIKELDIVEFQNKVKVTGNNITMYSFEEAHAFANPSNPKYNAKSAGEAQGYALQFIKEKLSLQ